MKKLMKIAMLSLLGMASARASTIPSSSEAGFNGAHFKKVVWIIFENEDESIVERQADFAKFAARGMSFVNFTGEAHPSQPNYISMIAGDPLGVNSDMNFNLSQSHVGDLLEKAGLDWRVYAEGYPGKCFTGGSSGKYARKHVPFVSFTNVTKNPQRCAKIMNATTFMSDFGSGKLPAFTMYIPDLNDDGHDTGVSYAGPWLSKAFGTILANPEALNDTLFILTFDESEQSNVGNQIYTVLLGKNVAVGSNVQHLNHISLLRMIEDEFGLGTLGRQDQSADEITNIWKN